MDKVQVLTERCKGCGLCIAACPRGNLAIGQEFNAQGYAHVVWAEGDKKCNSCAFCAEMCPDTALLVFKEDK